MEQTLLYNKHSQLGAKISDFAGFRMPISYSSVNKEEDLISPTENNIISKMESLSIKKKPSLTIDTNV